MGSVGRLGRSFDVMDTNTSEVARGFIVDLSPPWWQEMRRRTARRRCSRRLRPVPVTRGVQAMARFGEAGPDATDDLL
jgi:hypothetical protein